MMENEKMTLVQEVHFTYDIKFLTLLGIQQQYEKLRASKHDAESVILNSCFIELLKNEKETNAIWNEFEKFMNKKNEVNITIPILKEFTIYWIDEVLKKSDHFLKVALGYCNSFIYEPKTGYFKECGYSKHQDEIIAWLDICFPKGWELEEERNIVNFVKNSLVIKGNFFDKDKLIEDSVRFAPYIPRRKQWFD